MDHPPQVRVSDAERTAAVERLFLAHRDGRISLDELDGRLAVVHGAVVTGQPAPALHDLPVPVRRPSEDVVDVDAGYGGLTRTGRWVVPRRMRIQQHVDSGGLVLLDLAGAHVVHPVLDLELRLGMNGTAELVVPRGGSADLTRLRGPGRLRRTDVPTEPGAGLHVTVTGVTPRRSWVRLRHPR